MHVPMEITGKTKDGREFPILDGELLSWSIGVYMTLEQQRLGYPKARAVVRAMIDHRPEQLRSERYEMLKGSFDRVFGHNAGACLEVIDSEKANRVCK